MPLAFAYLARKAHPRLLVGYLALVGLGSLAVSLFITYNFADLFPGPGVCLSVLSLPLALYSLSVLWRHRPAIRDRWGEAGRRYRLFLIAVVLIPALQVTPLAGAALLTHACNAANRALGERIVLALEAYQGEHGHLPASLDALAPDYLPALPSPRCFAPFAWASWTPERADQPFTLQWCSDDLTLLVAPLVGDSMHALRYDLAGGRWTRASFEGMCALPE